MNPRAEQDLFDGIAGAKVDGPDAEHDVIAATLPAEILPPVTAQLRPRDNLRNFREWLKANGISRLMPQIPVHATLFSSVSPHTFEFEVQNNTNSVQRGVVFLDKGKDWPEWQDGGDFELPAGGNATIKAKGMYPSEELIGLGSHEVKVRVNSVVSSGFIDLVPTMGIPRQNTLPEVTADPDKWGPIGSGLKIAHTNLVQGQIKSPDECSGRFFVGWDDIDVQVLVDVTDDTVATNISPDDLKAHWRSTSVEICIDPTPFSENTFSTLKLGIFPQDASGKVRAARDADARPGPLERIGSKIKLASRMTPAGYVVEARIPWAEIYNDATRKPKKRDALGFNVIIYHAGAKQARVGEDIGKARLAWSYYRGVPGRPEVWGLAILK